MQNARAPHLPLLTAVLAISLWASVAQGQITSVTNATSTPIPDAGHEYIGMLNETVNPAMGSVSIRLNLLMPKGLGITVPFALAYDSNGFMHTEQAGAYIKWMSNVGFLSQGGWSYSVPMLSYYGTSQNFTWGGSSYPCYYYTDYVFQDPTGGRHSLGLGSVPDYNTELQNYKQNPDGPYPCLGLELVPQVNGGDTH